MNLNDHWLALDRAHEDNEAHLDAVDRLAESVYDTVYPSAVRMLAGIESSHSSVFVNGIGEQAHYMVEHLLLMSLSIESDIGTLRFNIGDIILDDKFAVDEDKLWAVVCEAAENHIKHSDDI